MTDELHVQVRYTIHDDESGSDFTDALYYPLADWPPDEAAMEAEKQARFAEWQQNLRQPEPEAAADAEPSPADKLTEARDLLSRLDELRLQAMTALEGLEAAAADGSH